MPSLRAPSRRTALFSFTSDASTTRMFRRFSISSQCGPKRSAVKSARPWRSRQCASVASGVRKQVVQFTRVPPPTPRPWRIVIARSSVARLPWSWYSFGYASLSCMWKSAFRVNEPPSSRRITRAPAAASRAAAIAPPGPEPTMQTSAESARFEEISCPRIRFTIGRSAERSFTRPPRTGARAAPGIPWPARPRGPRSSTRPRAVSSPGSRTGARPRASGTTPRGVRPGGAPATP